MGVLPKMREGLLSWQNFAVLFAVYFASLAFYRLFLHPLARFPGPRLAAITRWYEAYYDIVQNGQYTFKIAELHKKYGPIIRISPYELHVIDPTYFEKLYRQEGCWDKYEWTYNGFSAKGATIVTGSHELHKARRQPINHFFSKAKVAARQEIIHRNVAKLCNRLSQLAGNTVNLGAAISAIVRDVSCEFMLNKTSGALDKDDFNVAVTNMLQKGGVIWRITKHFPWFGPTMKSIPRSLLFKVADESTKEFFQHIQNSEDDTRDLLRIATTSSTGEEVPRTIVHELFNSNLPAAEKKFLRVMNDVATITGAGFETTASVLRLIFYHVFSNATILKRLRAELAAADGVPSFSDGEVEVKVLEKLPYLTSVIMEGMRLSPAIGTRMARIAPDRDLFYGDLRIPAGTPVGMTTILMHTDEKLYPEPMRFNPDRWMDLEAKKRLDKVYAPFSKGTRICLGMHLAWAEMYLVIATLVQRFDFKFEGIAAADFEMESDQFIIGTKAAANLIAHVASFIA
ncbi:cytochrome P450 [Camillea tinctor]|nr:cytochrome P450 [Camillea tinctor]